MLRQITFENGDGWIARLRLRQLDHVFGEGEAMEAKTSTEIKVASMKFLK